MQPTVIPALSLKPATDLRALMICAFWPVIIARSLAAASTDFTLVVPSPTPMFTTILTRRGTCILFL